MSTRGRIDIGSNIWLGAVTMCCQKTLTAFEPSQKARAPLTCKPAV